MAVAFADRRDPIDLGDPGPRLEQGLVGAHPHGAALVLALAADLALIAAYPLGHQAHDRLRRRTEFGRRGAAQVTYVPQGFDDGHLHAETDAEVGYRAFPRE